MTSGNREVRPHDPDFDNYPPLGGPLHVLDIAAQMIPDKTIRGDTARIALRNLGQRYSRGALRKLHDRAINQVGIQSEEDLEILDDLDANVSRTNGLEKDASDLLLRNTHLLGSTLIVTASRHYAEMWGRDSASAAHFAGSKLFTERVVSQFFGWANEEGNPPAQVNPFKHFFKPIMQYRDDETALRLGILALESGVGTDEQLEKNHAYIKTHVTKDGGYKTGSGPRHTMLDGLHFDNPAVLGHNTLLYADYMQQAVAKGMDTPEEAGKAIWAARRLAMSTGDSYFPTDDLYHFFDPTTLMGELFSLTSSGESILGSKIVKNTWEFYKQYLEGKPYGVVDPDGKMAPPYLFLNDYQLVNRWALWDNIIKSVAYLHGLINNDYQLEERARIGGNNFAEHDNGREGQVWTAEVLAFEKDVNRFMEKRGLQYRLNRQAYIANHTLAA